MSSFNPANPKLWRRAVEEALRRSFRSRGDSPGSTIANNDQFDNLARVYNLPQPAHHQCGSGVTLDKQRSKTSDALRPIPSRVEEQEQGAKKGKTQALKRGFSEHELVNPPLRLRGMDTASTTATDFWQAKTGEQHKATYHSGGLHIHFGGVLQEHLSDHVLIDRPPVSPTTASTENLPASVQPPLPLTPTDTDVDTDATVEDDSYATWPVRLITNAETVVSSSTDKQIEAVLSSNLDLPRYGPNAGDSNQCSGPEPRCSRLNQHPQPQNEHHSRPTPAPRLQSSDRPLTFPAVDSTTATSRSTQPYPWFDHTSDTDQEDVDTITVSSNSPPPTRKLKFTRPTGPLLNLTFRYVSPTSIPFHPVKVSRAAESSNDTLRHKPVLFLTRPRLASSSYSFLIVRSRIFRFTREVAARRAVALVDVSGVVVQSSLSSSFSLVFAEFEWGSVQVSVSAGSGSR